MIVAPPNTHTHKTHTYTWQTTASCYIAMHPDEATCDVVDAGVFLSRSCSLSCSPLPHPLSLAYACADAHMHAQHTQMCTHGQQQPLEHAHNSSLWIKPTCFSLSRSYSHITSLLQSVISPSSFLFVILSFFPLCSCLSFFPLFPFCSARSLLAICRSALLCLCREIPAAPTAVRRKRYNA